MAKKEVEQKIAEIEAQMSAPDFWADKQKAQTTIKEYQALKDELSGVGKYDKGGAVLTVFSGAGGDDAEDFSRMLFEMYVRFSAKKGWETVLVHENKNDHGGFRNVTIEISGANAYGTLKNESGVHRLVRLSPFNAKQQRHTSFSMVEVIPKFEKLGEITIPDDQLQIEYARSSGPGGQNVNKRETSVRLVHIPSGLSAHAESERSQAQNKEKALKILTAKIYRALEEEKIKEEEGMYVSKTTEVEWGNQIRSYVLHPYKMVKDHRTDVETSDVEAVLGGELDLFIEAERHLGEN